MIRRIFDLFVVILSLPLAVPALCILSAAVMLERTGPVFYKSTRLGRSGRPFCMIKFRTMYPEGASRLNAEQRAEFAGSFKIKNDPRITRLGCWLRKTSLDELPQVFNVLKGEMSLVGPRPKLPEEIAFFGREAEELLSITPGITGYWQVHRRTAASDEAMKQMELHYVRTRNFFMDLSLLLLTPLKMVFTDNE